MQCNSLTLVLVLCLLVRCNYFDNVSPKLIRRTESKVEMLCHFFSQEHSQELLASYQHAPSLTTAVNDVFTSAKDIQVWDQSGADITSIVVWHESTLLSDVIYIGYLHKSELLRVAAIVQDPKDFIFDNLLNCLGNPDSYSVELYPFGYGFPGVVADLVFLYYVEKNLMIEVIIPTGRTLTVPGTPVRFVGLHVFADDGLRTAIRNRAHPIFPQADIRPWNR